MPSVFRARNGAQFWGISVGGVSNLRYLDKPAPQPATRKGRAVWYKRGPKIKAKNVVGTQIFTTPMDDRANGASPLRPRVLTLLREYCLTGLTSPDIAALLGEDNGRVMGVLRTLVMRGLVKSAGKVWCARGKNGQRIHQWKLTEKIAEAAD